MKKKKPKYEPDAEDFIEYSPEAKAKMDADPRLQKAMQNMAAIFRQAAQAVNDGQYKTWEDAIEALAGSRPEKIDD